MVGDVWRCLAMYSNFNLQSCLDSSGGVSPSVSSCDGGVVAVSCRDAYAFQTFALLSPHTRLCSVKVRGTTTWQASSSNKHSSEASACTVDETQAQPSSWRRQAVGSHLNFLTTDGHKYQHFGRRSPPPTIAPR